MSECDCEIGGHAILCPAHAEEAMHLMLTMAERSRTRSEPDWITGEWSEADEAQARLDWGDE
jgi:hypothetical protein